METYIVIEGSIGAYELGWLIWFGMSMIGVPIALASYITYLRFRRTK